MMTVLSPGIMASVQDLGRLGYRHLGVGQAGAMDAMALRIGNMLVGNPEDAAAIEITLGGFRVRFLHDTVFALTGADTGAMLDDQPVPGWWLRRARAGQVLSCGMARRGMRAILALAGGIDLPLVMGARATDVKGGFGGHEGRWLRAGDTLALGAGGDLALSETGFGLAAAKLGLIAPESPVLRFLPAGEWLRHAPDLRAQFLDSAWRLSPDSNRMGFRLAGPALLRPPMELLSHGIVPGTIQLPPSGQPVIQMVDANTCGGYPKLGVVIGADMAWLAQARLGASLRFRPVTRPEALAAAQAQETHLRHIAAKIALARDLAAGPARAQAGSAPGKALA